MEEGNPDRRHADTRQIVYTLCLTKCTVHVWCIKNQSVIYVFTTANKSQD